MFVYILLGLGVIQLMQLVMVNRVYNRQTLMLEQLDWMLRILAVAHQPVLEAANAAREQAHAGVAPS